MSVELNGAQERVDAFNESTPVGTAIKYWAGAAGLSGVVPGVTSSRARLVGGIVPAVDVEGRLVCVPLVCVMLGRGWDGVS